MLHAGPTVYQRGAKGCVEMTIRRGRPSIRAIRNLRGGGNQKMTHATGGIGRPVKRLAHGEEAGFSAGGA